ncbi:hypothetical protein MTO96_031389 [Rhipicephalus appendiculatus]
MLVALGLDSRSVYEEDFEKPFLVESAQFYALRGQHYIETRDSLEYIAQVEQHINEESEKAKQCLNESTEVPLVQVIERELIWKHMKTIVDMEDSGVEHMIKNQMTDDLARLFRFLKRVPGGVKTLLDCVSKYLRNLGRSVVNEHGDSVSLIPKVMELRDHFDHILQHSFNSEELARDMIAADFECILSHTRKSPEYLSAFIDDMMRKGIRNMTKQETDQLLDKTKPRGTLVAKLRKECGCLFTSKMEAMFKDMHISGNTMKQFKDAVSSCTADLHGVDINVRVLTTGFWPLAAATQQSNIPVAPWSAYQVFQRFYLANHIGRRLTLQPHLGWADISAVFYGPAEDGPSTSQDGEHIVRRASAANLRHPDLQKVKIESTSSKKNNATTKKNEPSVNLDEDRRYELEAAIIRIMKARKTLSHEDLLVEVTKLLQTRYTPSPAAFRKRVDALVEREYLEKAGEDPEEYNYVP